jgi:hypothetical protein
MGYKLLRGAATRSGSGSDQMMRLLAAPAPQHFIIMSSSKEAYKGEHKQVKAYTDKSKSKQIDKGVRYTVRSMSTEV